MGFALPIDSRVVLAETPVWDPRLKKLYWTDLFEGTVHRFDPATGRDECAPQRWGPRTASSARPFPARRPAACSSRSTTA